MSWDSFIWFALAALVCWAAGAALAWKEGKRKIAASAYGLGILIFFAFIVAMWISLERPPLRTMGETRLWYSFFLAVAGFIVFLRWKYKWILSFSTLMALIFIIVNLMKPEIHSKALMPALQSPWFAPHVIVYMFSYGMLGAATLMALFILLFKKDDAGIADSSEHRFHATEADVLTTDNLVVTGLSFLTFGMLFGALWAQEAWGTYWGWDPKETWAAITWLCYMLYIHFRIAKPKDHKTAMWILLLAFVCLQICWWGINYLPSAHATSVHVY